MPDSKLARAARWNDAIAEEHGLVEAARMLNVDLEELIHLSRQRAMRVRMVQTGRFPELQAVLKANKPKKLRLSSDDEDAIEHLMPVYMDGILLGLRAALEED